MGRRWRLVSHCWLGCFPDERRLLDYFRELPGGGGTHSPLSEFARDQGAAQIDREFLEFGFISGAPSVKELARGRPYHKQFEDGLAERASTLGLRTVNTIVYISEDQIGRPRSVEGEGFWLRYVGTIDFFI
jgi:hypothetical protein